MTSLTVLLIKSVIDHPYYQDAVDFCHKWDSTSFDPDYESLPLEFFEPMVRRVFAREPFSAERANRAAA